MTGAGPHRPKLLLHKDLRVLDMRTKISGIHKDWAGYHLFANETFKAFAHWRHFSFFTTWDKKPKSAQNSKKGLRCYFFFYLVKLYDNNIQVTSKHRGIESNYHPVSLIGQLLRKAGVISRKLSERLEIPFKDIATYQQWPPLHNGRSYSPNLFIV